MRLPDKAQTADITENAKTDRKKLILRNIRMTAQVSDTTMLNTERMPTTQRKKLWLINLPTLARLS
jgi:hypothetical protein